jgi:hypothetical protein
MSRQYGEGMPRSKREERLSLEWMHLLNRLWEPDGQSIARFLPEIVSAIKATKSRSDAELALFNVLQAPKVRDMPRRLRSPAIVEPDYLAIKSLADAAELPLGKVRNEARKRINEHSRHVALSVPHVMDLLRPMSESGDEASKEKAKRARRELGISRRSGRPTKTGQ